jgi:hypothetical protein
MKYKVSINFYNFNSGTNFKFNSFCFFVRDYSRTVSYFTVIWELSESQLRIFRALFYKIMGWELSGECIERLHFTPQSANWENSDIAFLTNNH